jgi:hypothetical protein
VGARIPGDIDLSEPLLSLEEYTRLFTDLITGPRPRRIHPEVKSALLADLNRDEAVVVEGILEIVETGGASIEDLLESLDRSVKEGSDGGRAGL